MIFTNDLAVSPWALAALFAAGVLFLDWFDVSLPRGDSFGVSGALVSSGILILEGGSAMVLAVAALASLVLTHQLRRRSIAVFPIWSSLGIRALALVAMWIVMLSIDLSGVGISAVVVSVLAASAYLGAELAATQAWLAVATERSLGRLLRGNLRRQTPILAAQVSVSALVVVIFPTMGVYGLLPLVAVLLLIRQSYAVLLQMRETYQATVEVLVEAAEGQDPLLRGHAERTAHIAREICARLGMSAAHVERASYAALLHDVDAIALSDEERDADALGSTSLVMQDVAFLSEVLPVMRLCDGRDPGGVTRDVDAMIAMTVALASEIDAIDSGAVGRTHHNSVLQRVLMRVNSSVKARVVAAALELGYKTPAVS